MENVVMKKIAAPRSEDECLDSITAEYMKSMGVAVESTKYLALIRRNIGEILLKYYNPTAAKIPSFNNIDYATRCQFRHEATGIGNDSLTELSVKLTERGIPQAAVSPKTLRNCIVLAVAYTSTDIEDMVMVKKHSLTNLICAAALQKEEDRVKLLAKASDEGKTTVTEFQRMFDDETVSEQLTPTSQAAKAAAESRTAAPKQRSAKEPDGRSRKQKAQDQALGIHNNQSIASMLSKAYNHTMDHVLPTYQNVWTAVADDIMQLDAGKERDAAYDRAADMVKALKEVQLTITSITNSFEKLTRMVKADGKDKDADKKKGK